MAHEDVVRMISFRPVVQQTESWRQLRPYAGTGRATEFSRQLQSAGPRVGKAGPHVELANKHRSGPSSVKRVDDLAFGVRPLLDWAVANAGKKIKDAGLPALLQASFKADAAALVANADFQAAWERLADTILADSVASGLRTRPLDEAGTALKLMMLVETFGRKPPAAPPDVTVGEWLSRTALVLTEGARRPGFAPGAPRSTPQPTQPAPLPAAEQRLKRMETAREELLTVVRRQDAFEPVGEEAPSDCERRLAAMEHKLTAPGEATHARLPAIQDRANRRMRPRLAQAAAQKLSGDTRTTLAELHLDTNTIEPFMALSELDIAITQAADAVAAASVGEPPMVMHLGGFSLDIGELKKAFGDAPGQQLFAPHEGCGFEVGIGDLLIVRQTLKAYELADFAHVENVMMGETREREHRRLDVREETFTTESESETEKERDLQSTDRNEMQTEAQKTIKNDFGIQAGVQISGSYGPTVSFTSSLALNYSTSSQETQRQATQFAREVTSRTAERTRERVREERKLRVLQQTEELNRHKLENAPAPKGHIRGIYRWLNKVYDAQVFNYGQRMLYEFIVPEPAAFFLWAMVDNAPADTTLLKPQPPWFKGHALLASDLTLGSVQEFIQRYSVIDAPPYPAASIVVSHFDGLDDTGNFKTKARAAKIEIPSGYDSQFGLVSSLASGMNLESFIILIGGKHVGFFDDWATLVQFVRRFEREISVVVYGGSISAYTVGIDLYCSLSPSGLRKWQDQAFDAITRAYLTQKAAYEDKLAALQIQRGIQILGRNPLENRRIERDELQKHVISMLTDDSDPSLDGFLPGAEPVIDLEAACDAGSRIRFFENAFEWRNMTYLFYPYFWGRKARWLSALRLTDPDPDFAAFLKAGAARVQVPVRPGFEKAIAYYCQTGKIWAGGDPPLIGDQLYVPIIEEITENLGKLDDGVPYPEGSKPWDVRVPTSLVLVQDLEEIPGIVDPLSGKSTALLPPGP